MTLLLLTLEGIWCSRGKLKTFWSIGLFTEMEDRAFTEDLIFFQPLLKLELKFAPSLTVRWGQCLMVMVFDQTVRQISKGHIKYCFLYLDSQLNDLVMVIGNWSTLSFDLKKIKALRVKQHNLLQGTPVVPKAKALKRVPQSLNLSVNLLHLWGRWYYPTRQFMTAAWNIVVTLKS